MIWMKALWYTIDIHRYTVNISIKHKSNSMHDTGWSCMQFFSGSGLFGGLRDVFGFGWSWSHAGHGFRTWDSTNHGELSRLCYGTGGFSWRGQTNSIFYRHMAKRSTKECVTLYTSGNKDTGWRNVSGDEQWPCYKYQHQTDGPSAWGIGKDSVIEESDCIWSEARRDGNCICRWGTVQPELSISKHFQ